jgi:hypothetical protein
MRLKVGVALAECCDIPMTERPWINAMEQREDTDVVNPRADNDDTICSTWVSRRCRFRTILGLKVARGSAAVNSQRVNAQAHSNIRYQRVPQSALLGYICAPFELVALASPLGGGAQCGAPCTCRCVGGLAA